jgi:hypothetical protein
MTERLTPEREAEFAAAVAQLDADRALSFGTWTASPVTEKSTLPPEQAFGVEDVARIGGAVLRGSVGVFGDEHHAAFTAMAQTAIPELLAELVAVRAERDQAQAELEKYVGKEPTVAEEMEYLSNCFNAVHDLCDKAEQEAKRWEHPLPVPEWVEEVRKAATGERANEPSDNRHRLYIDGKGNGWISVCSDEGTEWVVPVHAAAFVEKDVRDVADETGSLREIGRCW